jgi:hypothetical protein
MRYARYLPAHDRDGTEAVQYVRIQIGLAVIDKGTEGEECSGRESAL